MKPKTKVLTAVLVCGALVLAFTACAGCTGTDSNDSMLRAWWIDHEVPSATELPVKITGTWVGNTQGYDVRPIYKIYEDASLDRVLVNEILLDKNDDIVYNYDENGDGNMTSTYGEYFSLWYIGNYQYQSGPSSYIYTISEDGQTLTLNQPSKIYTYFNKTTSIGTGDLLCIVENFTKISD